MARIPPVIKKELIPLVGAKLEESVERLKGLVEGRQSNEERKFSLVDCLLVEAGYVREETYLGGEPCREVCGAIIKPTAKGLEFYNKYLKEEKLNGK